MNMKKTILTILFVCVLVAGAFQAPALADGSTVVFSGTVHNGDILSGNNANNCYVTFTVGNDSVHATIVSPDYQKADTLLPTGQSVYYYDQLILLVGSVNNNTAEVTLSKPSTAASVSTGTKVTCDTPGQTALGGDAVTFPITIQNNHDSDMTYTLSATGDSGWGLGFQYQGKDITQVYVPASQSKVVDLVAQTPYTTTIGNHGITVNTGDGTVGLNVDITSVNQTVDVSTKVSTVIAYLGDNIYYDFSLQNMQAQTNNYMLSVSGLPSNWYYRFVSQRGSTDEIAETVVPATSTQNLVLQILPSLNAEGGTYNFTATVTTPDNLSYANNLTLELKTGSSMSVTSDKLAYDAQPGQAFNINVYAHNTGTGSALTDVYPSVSAPSGWIVTTSPNSTNSIKAGDSQTFVISVQPPGNIVASDYEVDVTMKSDQAQSTSNYRITITTSDYIPYIGAVIILVVLAGLFFMYRKYGRR